MDVSIALLTRNGGRLLDEVLAALSAQRYAAGRVELLAVDTSSTDGTPEKLARAGARVVTVTPAEFDHGATRDLAIERSSGEVVVLLVQDAVPGSPDWLAGFVREFERPALAGAWCRQVARPDCPAVAAMRLRESLPGSMQRRLGRLEPGQALSALDPGERLRLCSFDNVASAVRRSVWEKIPFGRCAFAEDLQWGRRAIEAGHEIAFTPDVHVVHSHDRSVAYEYKRTYLAHYALHQLFALRTVPKLGGAWRSLWSSGDWIRCALRDEPTASRRILGALRAPVERFATAVAQYEGARDAATGRPPRRFRGV